MNLPGTDLAPWTLKVNDFMGFIIRRGRPLGFLIPM